MIDTRRSACFQPRSVRKHVMTAPEQSNLNLAGIHPASKRTFPSLSKPTADNSSHPSSGFGEEKHPDSPGIQPESLAGPDLQARPAGRRRGPPAVLPEACDTPSCISHPGPGAVFLTVRQVAERLAISIPTVWRWARLRDDFPQSVHLGPGVSRWHISEISAFEDRCRGRS